MLAVAAAEINFVALHLPVTELAPLEPVSVARGSSLVVGWVSVVQRQAGLHFEAD